jgi:hypothetical protein
MNINSLTPNPAGSTRNLSSVEMQWINAMPPEQRGQAAQQMMMFKENELVSLMSQQLGQMTGMSNPSLDSFAPGPAGGAAGGQPKQLSPEEAEARADRRLAQQMQMQQVSEEASLRSTLAKIMHDTSMAIINNMK